MIAFGGDLSVMFIDALCFFILGLYEKKNEDGYDSEVARYA